MYFLVVEYLNQFGLNCLHLVNSGKDFIRVFRNQFERNDAPIKTLAIPTQNATNQKFLSSAVGGM